MAIHTTNDFNKISLIPWSQLTAAQQNILMTMALNGDSIVSPFDGVLDRQGLTPEARARKEREEAEQFRDSMARLEEQQQQFRQELDRLEQASFEALQENEEKLREARKQLREIQDRAYTITLPDGTVARVYRDGDKVRTESGAEVSRDVVRAEDIPSSSPVLSDFSKFQRRVEDLEKEHKDIKDYTKRVHETRSKPGNLSADGGD